MKIIVGVTVIVPLNTGQYLSIYFEWVTVELKNSRLTFYNKFFYVVRIFQMSIILKSQNLQKKTWLFDVRYAI